MSRSRQSKSEQQHEQRAPHGTRDGVHDEPATSRASLISDRLADRRWVDVLPSRCGCSIRPCCLPAEPQASRAFRKASVRSQACLAASALNFWSEVSLWKEAWAPL